MARFLFAPALLLAGLLAACGGASAGGIPDDCEIRVGEQCYATQAEACAAASCPEDRCLILETYPGQIECQDESPAPVEGGDESVSSTDPAP